MNRYRGIYFLVPLLLAILSCRMFNRLVDGSLSPGFIAGVTDAAKVFNDAAKATLLPRLPDVSVKEYTTEFTPQEELQATLPAGLETEPSQSQITPQAQTTPEPTVTLLVLPTPTRDLIELPKENQLAIFAELWQIIAEDYLYPDFNGLDWDAIRIEYSQKIEDGITAAEFYLAMDEMILRLGDEHSVFLNPVEVQREDAEYGGSYDYVGVGILVAAVPERKRAVILVTFPDSPAETAGLRPRDNILEVDGKPILDGYGFLRNLIRGPEGSQVTLTVQTPGADEARLVTLTRQRILTSMPVPYTFIHSPGGQLIGYIYLVTFADSTLSQRLEEALVAMTSNAELDGLIIDNRHNGGGADTVLRQVLSYFISGRLGHFISREGERPLVIRNANDIHESLQIPLVVLIGGDTVSYGEVFAGVLQDSARAFLIGETTEGNIETLWGYDFEDGSRAWIAHETFRPLNDPAQNWEQFGVIPDLEIIAGWDQYTFEQDPLILAALEYLDARSH